MKNTHLSASVFAAVLVIVSPLASSNSENPDVAAESLFSNTPHNVVKKARSASLNSNKLASIISSRESTQDHQATQQLIHLTLPSDNKSAQ